MLISQKSQYALRAVLELAERWGHGPVKIADVAAAREIPPRFLSVILGQLKHRGLVHSHRGKQGGYTLAVAPTHLSVADVLSAIRGQELLAECLESTSGRCELHRDCVFYPVWSEAQRAVDEVLGSTTFARLVEDSHAQPSYVPTYCI